MADRAVIFDLDDTLYASDSFVRGGIRAASRLLRARGFVSPDPEAVLLDVLRTEGPFSLFDTGFRVLGVERTPELVSSLVAAFRSHEPAIAPYPGIPDLVARLREDNIVIGLVTDGYADVQRSKWRVLGLAHLFDVTVFCRDIDGRDHPKPDPYPFARAFVLLGEPEKVVFVGDNPAMDFPAPDSFGWDTVRMCWPGASHCLDGDTNPRRQIASDALTLGSFIDRIFS